MAQEGDGFTGDPSEQGYGGACAGAEGEAMKHRLREVGGCTCVGDRRAVGAGLLETGCEYFVELTHYASQVVAKRLVGERLGGNRAHDEASQRRG